LEVSEFTTWKMFVYHCEISIVSRHLDHLCFMHMATNPSSSSHCAHDSQPKLKSILCTWQPTQVQVHIVHMGANLSLGLQP
jgi:hypothetical protein